MTANSSLPITPGGQYTRRQLYDLFEITEDQRGGDWATGYHRHGNLWFIFATVSGPGRTGHDYQNHWAADGSFVWFGKNQSKQSHSSIQSMSDPRVSVLLFTREHDRDPFIFHGVVRGTEPTDSVPVSITWRAQEAPTKSSPQSDGDDNEKDEKTSEIPYLLNVQSSEFYTKIRNFLESQLPLTPRKLLECDLQTKGGYELSVEATIKDGETFSSNRLYADVTRFPARIRAAATVLRDTGNFGHYSIKHREGLLTIAPFSEEFAPTADEAKLQRATKKLLERGPLKEVPLGVEKPAVVVVTQRTYARDPHVRAWVLASANGYCEACSKSAPFLCEDGSPFLEVHHVKMLCEGGSDRTTNAAALCPNCHRRFHHSADRVAFVDSLYQLVPRLIRE